MPHDDEAVHAPLTTSVPSSPDESAAQAVQGLEGVLDQPASEPVTLRRNVVAVLLIALGVGFGTLMPALVALPVVIARITPDSKDVVLGSVLAVQAFLGMSLAPFFGAVSDRTTSRFGMRRPGIALGGTGIVTGLLILGFARDVPGIFMGVTVMALGSSLSSASSFAVIPDAFPDRTRGRILGLKALTATLAGLAASIIGPMFLGNQVMLFGVGAIVLAVCFLVALALLKDRRLARADVPDQALLKTAFSGYKYNPRTAPDFSWIFASRFVFTLGIAFSTTFAVYFLTDELGITAEELPPLIALNSIISLAGTAGGTLAGAVLADKVSSRRNLVLAASILMAIGASTAAFAPSPLVFFIGTTLITLSIGLFIPTDGSLVMAVLPGGNKHAAKFMAIIGIADQLPRSFGPLVAPAVLAVGAMTALGSYSTLYLCGAVAAVAGGLIVRKVTGAR